jgi:protein-L-isoaspartate(D-aspartate) O-methyltransferase
MVAQQIAAQGITDVRVLAAMKQVPRHLFIPTDNRDLSYCDSPVGIGQGQTISQPYLVALMSERLQLEPGMRVLEIGTGSGYQAAILHHMGAQVHSIEIRPELARRAAATLAQTGFSGVQLQQGDGLYGWDQAARFERIIVTAAPADIPHPLPEQLHTGGFMLVPTGNRVAQTLFRYTRGEKDWHCEALAAVRFVPMTGDVAG